jgi:hypothetical protein
VIVSVDIEVVLLQDMSHLLGGARQRLAAGQLTGRLSIARNFESSFLSLPFAAMFHADVVSGFACGLRVVFDASLAVLAT